LWLCVIGCDNYYERLATDEWLIWPSSTPSATPDATADAWITPVGPEDCTVEPRPEEQVAGWLQNPPDRNTTTTLLAEPATTDIAEAAASAARTWIACGEDGLEAQRHAIESPQFIFYQGMDSITDPARYGSFEDWQWIVETLGDLYLTDEPMNYIIFSPEVTPSAEQQQYAGAIGVTLIAQPEHALSLPDGRVALPLTWVYQSEAVPAEAFAE
jgi:hypothetical protein